MKFTPARWAAFLRKPDPGVGAMLIFGRDRGLVRERADQVAALVVGVGADPFRSVEVSAGQLRGAPGTLADEALSFGLVPGRRVLRIREAGDAISEAVRRLLAAERWEAFVLLEAADLARRSSLRELMEDAANAAAVPCYEDDSETLRQVIDQTLSPAGLTASVEAVEYLVTHLGNDRGVTRSELEKLTLYMGGGQSGQARSVGLEDVIAIVGDARSAMVGEVAMAIGGGDRAVVVRAIGQAVAAGVEPIGMLRMVAAHLQRLYLVAREAAAGRPLKEAISGLRPPVFFREVDAFARQVRRWSPEALEAAMQLVLEAELQCKQTGVPQRALAERACLRIVEFAGSRR